MSLSVGFKQGYRTSAASPDERSEPLTILHHVRKKSHFKVTEGEQSVPQRTEWAVNNFLHVRKKSGTTWWNVPWWHEDERSESRRAKRAAIILTNPRRSWNSQTGRVVACAPKVPCSKSQKKSSGGSIGLHGEVSMMVSLNFKWRDSTRRCYYLLGGVEM